MAFPGIGQYVNTNPCDWKSFQSSTMDDKDKTLFKAPAEANLKLTRTLVEEEVSWFWSGRTGNRRQKPGRSVGSR